MVLEPRDAFPRLRDDAELSLMLLGWQEQRLAKELIRLHGPQDPCAAARLEARRDITLSMRL